MGQYIFQEVDLSSAFKDVAVLQQTMLATSDFSKLAQKAYVNALRNGGVSQIIMPDDIQTQIVSPIS
jgi:thiamine pyrophosphate-dependent acetolactate synthase large subunit-like protein